MTGREIASPLRNKLSRRATGGLLESPGTDADVDPLGYVRQLRSECPGLQPGSLSPGFQGYYDDVTCEREWVNKTHLQICPIYIYKFENCAISYLKCVCMQCTAYSVELYDV